MIFTALESMLQHRNTLLDKFFYDVDSLSDEEQEYLTVNKNAEGSIIVIPPKKSNAELSAYQTASEFAKSEHKGVSRFVISGVGSSDLGSAALARNVADFFDEPVATIVAGYGIKDLMSEALGGWFSLGMANKKSYISEKVSENSELDEHVEFVTGNPDSTTMLSLLMNEQIEITMLLGHSKGCLSLSNALFGFVDLANDSLIEKRSKDITLITTGSVIDLPDPFENAQQFLGGYDWFGGLNSRIGLDFNSVAGAWHHTNTSLPLSLSIQDILATLNPEMKAQCE